MTYESTGEVRVPKHGEHFLCRHQYYTNVVENGIDDVLTVSEEVIMRPVREKKRVGYQVVIPFLCRESAEQCQQELLNANFSFGSVIEEYER